MRELFIGVDVGGTTVKLGICDADGHVHGRGNVATDQAARPDDMLERLAVAARKLIAEAGPARACGVGTPGPLDPDRRTLSRANHLPTWKDVAIPDNLGSKLGICDADGHVHGRGNVATNPAARPDDMLERIAAVARKLIGEAGPARACGVGTPGPLDPERRTLSRANHLPTWKDVAIPDILGSKLGIPVVLENDGNCAAWGESCVGVGRGARAIVLFTLGTGVGGGIVLDGELWTGVGGGVVLDGELWAGAGGAAGAFGHLVVDPAGPLCLCGQHGCLEQYASATSVARRFRHRTAAEAFAAAQYGDTDGEAAVAEACNALAVAIAATIHTLQPDLVIIGGGMAAAGDALLLPVCEGVHRRVRPAWLERTRIALGSLGGDAGWIGAALWAAHTTSTVRRPSPRKMTASKD